MLKSKKLYIFIMLSMIINIFYIVFKESTPIDVNAGVLYEPGTGGPSTATWFYFSTNDTSSRAQFYRATTGDIGNYNTSLRSSVPEAYYGNSRKMFKERYLNEYLWFTTNMPQTSIDDVRTTDLSYIYENRQTSVGTKGKFLVTEGDMTYAGKLYNVPYRYNLKTGTINDSGKYMGHNSGHQQILIGSFYGKYFEWRYTGYDENGEPMHNPYFPDDYYSTYGTENFTAHQNYWKDKSWYTSPWTRYLYQKVYGSSTRPKYANTQNMETYFLKKYPLFKNRGNASYWTERIVPMSNPAISATIWTGVHNYSGSDYYVVFTTGGPPQPNLRMTYFGIFDDNDVVGGQDIQNAKASRIRKLNTQSSDSTYTIKPQEELVAGETVRLYSIYANQSLKDNDKFNIPASAGGKKLFTVDYLIEHDNDIGKLSKPLSAEYNGLVSYETKNTLGPNQTVGFNVPYVVGKANKSGKSDAKGKVNMITSVPEAFYHSNMNMYTDDDTLEIQMNITASNLKPEFVEFRDSNGLTTDSVEPGQEYTVVYKLIKQTGPKTTVPASKAYLHVSFYDVPQTTKVAQNILPVDNAVYNKSGTKQKLSVLTNAGDYALYEAKITPSSTKMCSFAQIDNSKYASIKPNPNENTSDDKTPEECKQNELNIIVAEVKAKENPIILPNGTSTTNKSITLGHKVTLDVTKTDSAKPYQIVLYYTLDGKLATNNYGYITMQGASTVEVLQPFNSFSLQKDKTYVAQVEANPLLSINGSNTRLIKEFTNSNANPYEDNAGFDNVKVKGNATYCPVNRQANNWTQSFSIQEIDWWKVYTKYSYYWNSKTYYSTQGPFSFFEKFNVSKLEMEVTGSNKKYNLLNGKGKIKAGESFSLNIQTHYQSNANIEKSIYFVDNGGSYSNNILVQYNSTYYDRYVSPTYRVSHNYSTEHDLYVSVKFGGKTYKIPTIETGASGTVQNKYRTFELPLNEGKAVVYVGEDVKNGDYQIGIETTGFYGTSLKPSASSNLCINSNYTIQVQGSTNDDVKTHINNDFN